MSCRHRWETIETMEHDASLPTLDWCANCGTLRNTKYKRCNYAHSDKMAWSGRYGLESWDYDVESRRYTKPRILGA